MSNKITSVVENLKFLPGTGTVLAKRLFAERERELREWLGFRSPRIHFSQK